MLLLIFVGTGMLLVVALFAVRLRSLLRHDPVPVVAIAVMLGLDLLGVALSGSFWTPYLFVPLPGLALALAALVAHDHLDRVRHRVTPVAVGLVVVSSIVALVGWTGAWVAGRVPVEVRTGEAIAAAAWPGDRVLVYGGRADIQWATGAQSPYPYLWSLPMRTLDPGLDDLEEVLTGSNPPTWFVEATFINTWSELGTAAIQSSLIRKYEFVQTACGRYRIYHLNTVDPVERRRRLLDAVPDDLGSAERAVRHRCRRPGRRRLPGRRVLLGAGSISGRGRDRDRPAAGSSSSGLSTISVSVVSSIAAIEVALTSAERVTLTGSRTPWATRSPYSSVAAL